MNMKKIKNLILLVLFVVCLTATTSHARVLLEDFTYENRELHPVVNYADLQLKNGALCFDYSTTPQDGKTYSNYVYQPWVNAEKMLYVDFTFKRNVIDNTSVNILLRNYDTVVGAIRPLYLEGDILTLGYQSDNPKTIEYPKTGGRAALYAQDVESGCQITLYIDGVEEHTYTANGFFLKAGQFRFETRFLTAAKQNAGDTAPVISFDNIKILQDEAIPTALYAAEAQMQYDFENSGTFFMSESVFPFYKIKNIRQIANFSNEEQSCENILVQRGDGDSYTLETVTLQPGEVYLAEFMEDAAHLDDVRKVESYVWDSLEGLSPIVKKSASTATHARADRPEVLSQKLGQIGQTHPRLLTTSAELAKVEQYKKADKTFANMYEVLLDWKNTHPLAGYMTCTIPNHGIRRSDLCDMIYHRATVWGYLYQVTGDEKYAEELMEAMVKIAGYDDWYHTEMFLNTAHIARSMAIGYDMIYDYLSKSENIKYRDIITNAIYEKAILKFIDFQRKDEENGWQRRSDNWNMICNSGIGTACLAIGNLPEYKEMCGVALNYALRTMRYSAEYFNPEGGWTEGPNYYAYMMSHSNDFFASLINTLGDDYGYCDFEGLNKSAYDPLVLAGSKYAYAYSDTPTNISKNMDTMVFFAKYLDMPELGYFRRDWFNKAFSQVNAGTANKSIYHNTSILKDLLWYDPSFQNEPTNAGNEGYDNTYGLPLDYCYRGLGVVALHTDYGETQGFAAANYGVNNDWHNHTDMGSFVYEAQGEQWFVELGAVGTSWQHGNTYDDRRYRNKPEGHNCMIFNPTVDDYDQIVNSEGSLAAEPVFGEDESYFVMELTNGYEDRLNSYKRMIYLDKNTQGFAVKDRFSLKGTDNEYYWFAHTKAEIVIDEDDLRTAILTQNGKQLKVHVEGGEFTQMAAERLFPLSEESGLIADPANTGVNKLVVHATGKSGECEITVTAVPIDNDGNGTLPDVSSAFFPSETDIHGLDAVTFGGAEEAALADTNFAEFWDNFFVKQGEGFKYNTNPTNAAIHKEGFRIITAPGGPNGSDDYYAKLEKDDVTAGNTVNNNLSLAYRYNSNRFGSADMEAKVWNDGIVHLSYDILLPAYNAEGVDWAPTGSTNTWDTSFSMCIGAPSNKAFNMIRYNEWRNQFTFEGMIPGRNALVPIAVGKWVHFDWKLDYVNRTAEVKVDDYQVMNDKAGSPYHGTPTLEMSDALANAGFEGVAFNWFGSKGSVGIDNLEIKYELVKPYIKSVDFGDGNVHGNKVLTSATTATVEIPGKVFSLDGSVNIASYVSLVDSNDIEVTGAAAEIASDGKTVNLTIPDGALTAGENYSIKFSGNIPIGREGHTQVGTDTGDYTIKTVNIDTAYVFTAVNALK